MNATQIKNIAAYVAVSDSALPAIEAVATLKGGAKASVLCCPAFASAPYDCGNLYDKDGIWGSFDPSNAVKAINEIIAPQLVGLDASNQAACDAVLMQFDKAQVGKNATAAVSMAILKAAAEALEIGLYKHLGGQRAFTLPLPSHLSQSGSTRYGGPYSAGYHPEYSFIAYDFATFEEASYGLWEATSTMELKLKGARSLGVIDSDQAIWDLMTECIFSSGNEGKVGIMADLSAHSFYDAETGLYKGLFDKQDKTRDELMQLIIKLVSDYPFVSIEDPLMADDFDGFAYLTQNTDIQIVGDALFACDKDRFIKGIQLGAANAISISVAQAGTVSEAAEIAQLAYENNYGMIASRDRGERLDQCDIAVGLNMSCAKDAGMLYTGNRLRTIEDEIGSRARFFGSRGLRGKRFQLR